MGKRFQDHQRTYARAPRRGTCPSRKIRHTTHGDALDAALSSSLSYGMPFRAYECSDCKGWHVTSKARPKTAQKPAETTNAENEA